MKESKIKILIIDDDEKIIEEIVDYFYKNKYIEIIGSAKNGEEGLQMITAYEPDLILLDVVMPNLDGIEVLERLKYMGLNYMPSIIMISYSSQPQIIQKTLSLGAKFYIIKPFNFGVLEQRIRDIKNYKVVNVKNSFMIKENGSNYNFTEPLSSEDIEIVISNMLHEAGIPAHLKGYQFLVEAIKIVSSDLKRIDFVTKGLYPQVGARFDMPADKVERAIRHAVNTAWHRVDESRLSEMLGYNIANTKKPSNAEFIAMIADKLRLELKRNKEFQETNKLI